MNLRDRYKLLITGDTKDLSAAGGRSSSIIGHLMERLLTGQEAGVQEELASWKIDLRQVEDLIDPAVLRAATEEDVELALSEGCLIELPLTTPTEVLEAFNCILDAKLGPKE